MFARKITVWVRGDTRESAVNAFDEAIERLHSGNTSGNDVSESGAFYFENVECPADEVPYDGLPKLKED